MCVSAITTVGADVTLCFQVGACAVRDRQAKDVLGLVGDRSKACYHRFGLQLHLAFGGSVQVFAGSHWDLE